MARNRNRNRQGQPAGGEAMSGVGSTKGRADGADQPMQLKFPGKGTDKDLLEQARERYRRGFEADRENKQEMVRDLQFFDGQNNSQWPAEAIAQRVADNRPILTFNQLPPRVRQITGDMRQMRPSVKAVPVDDRGDVKTAEIITGMIRYVENRSNAMNVYFRAADSQVVCGMGGWMVVREYANPQTFNQEIRIVPIKDAVSIVWDPDSVEITREDANWVHIPIDMTRAEFKRLYPNANPSPLDGLLPEASQYWQTDGVRINQYWWKEATKRTVAMGDDGSVIDLTEKPDELAQAKRDRLRIEVRDSIKIRVMKMTAADILERPVDWPGMLLPIVPLIGEEIVVGAKTYRKGLVRNARDPQRAYNYFRSTQAEIIGLQPKSPFIGTDEMFKGFEDEWNSANTKNWPYLRFSADPTMPGGKPERSAPPLSSQGVNEAVMMAAEDLKSVTGIFDANLGARSNETSGKAIAARQKEGDVGSFFYISNFGFAVQHTGRIICDLIPHVYDTQRTLRIIGEDGKVDVIAINAPAGPALDGVAKIENDVTTGAYDVVMEIGPSYSTKREEARDSMAQLAQSAPEIVQSFADLYVKAQDWPLADKIAKRLERMQPPQIRMAEAQEAGDQEALQQLAAEMQQMQEQAANQPPPPEALKAMADAEREKAAAQRTQMELQIKAMDREIKVIDRDIAEISRATAEANALAKVSALGQPLALAAPQSPSADASPADGDTSLDSRVAGLEAALHVITGLLTGNDDIAPAMGEEGEAPAMEAAEAPEMDMAEAPMMPIEQPQPQFEGQI